MRRTTFSTLSRAKSSIKVIYSLPFDTSWLEHGVGEVFIKTSVCGSLYFSNALYSWMAYCVKAGLFATAWSMVSEYRSSHLGVCDNVIRCILSRVERREHEAGHAAHVWLRCHGGYERYGCYGCSHGRTGTHGRTHGRTDWNNVRAASPGRFRKYDARCSACARNERLWSRAELHAD
ncbi:hypothetical protein ElyMa_002041400 [Elysia marginata]|uniref:C2H2-type domain-containing protein n=1 Tax=Elysia marginata TaxID=1093978 RepID=A0AAV4F8T5_9GAST|nr:hypothetical protein ElyMa_002041400 [Elysia marginata]